MIPGFKRLAYHLQTGYDGAMKATLEIDELLMQQLQDEAQRRGATPSALAEAGIRNLLSEDPPAASDRPELPVWKGSVELVDISNREELYRVLDASDGPELPELPTFNSGGELVDISNREELYRFMDEYDGFRY